ncbi:MAG TPA: hypothetical protein VKB47_17985 [Terracidiphilus sp.]|nr:hypothetical protein [Terracidiphilus sp.]
MRFRFAAGALALAFLFVAHAQQPTQPRRPAPPRIATHAPAVTPIAAATTAPAGHYVALAWGASIDSVAGNPGTTNVYKITGTCPATLPAAMEPGGVVASGWVLESTLNAPSYTAAAPFYDTAVSGGQTYSYVVTALVNGGESGPSNCTTGVTGNFPPANLQVVHAQ